MLNLFASQIEFLKPKTPRRSFHNYSFLQNYVNVKQLRVKCNNAEYCYRDYILIMEDDLAKTHPIPKSFPRK